MASSNVAEVVANLRRQIEARTGVPLKTGATMEETKPAADSAKVVNFPKPEPVKVPDALAAELERLKAENAALKARKPSGLPMKVSEKGALSLYGLGRFPVSLYKEQWLKVLGQAEEIKAFIVAHDSELKAKE